MFIRDPGLEADGAYIANMKEIARSYWEFLDGRRAPNEIFEPRGRLLATWESLTAFKQLLVALHQLAVLGKSGNQVYWPRESGPNSFTDTSSAKILAFKNSGLLRHLSPQIPKQMALAQERNIPSEVQNEILRFRRNPVIVTLRHAGIPSQYYVPRIDGFSNESLPRYKEQSLTSKYIYYYPSPEQMLAYLRAMETSHDMLLRLTVERPMNQFQTLSELARYYHLGVVAHPFFRVNNSILMTQVNVILMRIGLKPVAHGHMDYVVRALDSSSAVEYFLDYVARNQE